MQATMLLYPLAISYSEVAEDMASVTEGFPRAIAARVSTDAVICHRRNRMTAAWFCRN